MSVLETKIEFLKGVGPKRAALLNTELSIFNFYDLLTFFPFRYIDRSTVHKINQIKSFDIDFQLIGFVERTSVIGSGRKKRLVVEFADETGKIEIIFFKGINWLLNSIKKNQKYLIFGRPNKFGGKISFAHPEMELIKNSELLKLSPIHPVYHSTEKLKNVGLNSKGISILIKNLLSKVENFVNENLSLSIINKYSFISRPLSLKNMHFPSCNEILLKSIKRFKYEELFFLQLTLFKNKIIRKKRNKSFKFNKVGRFFNDFYFNHLQFELTNAQKKVMKEIRNDLGSGFQMNRLLQGDVGSGKTVVAVMSMLISKDNGFQSCVMAPTEILANQHFESIKEFSDKLNINVELLTGKLSSRKKTSIVSRLKKNQIDIIVGTHALIQDNVKFSNLGLVIIDEQHKFGVSQRAKLWSNNMIFPHVLVMTATPIPRTLAMTAYGDLDFSIIDQLPPNRKPVSTKHFYFKELKKIYSFIFDELTQNRQVYVVYPLIEESKLLDYKNLMDGYENMKTIFGKKGFQVSMLHGKMNNDDKLSEMSNFLLNKTQILVSTTVVEVGVNVPNASVMVIQNAEKFGLSQLHQLRGRVGRGENKSHCILLTSNKLTNDSKTRLKAMVDTNDGFKISEIDLKLRGPGDVLGTRQSGLLNLKLSSLIKDNDILKNARLDAQKIIIEDFELVHSSNRNINQFFYKKYSKLLKWSSVS